MAKKGTTKYKSNLQENTVAKDLGGRRQINSGAFWDKPADVKTDDLLVECKTTENGYYALTLDTWLKLLHESLKEGMRIPVMQIDLENGKTRIAVMNASSFSDCKGFEDLCTGITIYTDKKSIRIYPKILGNIISFTSYIDLIAIEWKDFLEILKRR